MPRSAHGAAGRDRLNSAGKPAATGARGVGAGRGAAIGAARRAAFRSPPGFRAVRVRPAPGGVARGATDAGVGGAWQGDAGSVSRPAARAPDFGGQVEFRARTRFRKPMRRPAPGALSLDPSRPAPWGLRSAEGLVWSSLADRLLGHPPRPAPLSLACALSGWRIVAPTMPLEPVPLAATCPAAAGGTDRPGDRADAAARAPARRRRFALRRRAGFWSGRRRCGRIRASPQGPTVPSPATAPPPRSPPPHGRWPACSHPGQRPPS